MEPHCGCRGPGGLLYTIKLLLWPKRSLHSHKKFALTYHDFEQKYERSELEAEEGVVDTRFDKTFLCRKQGRWVSLDPAEP